MEILNTFGFNPILFLAQIVNFLIVMWVLRKFLYKPIVTMLDKRRYDIKVGLKQADDARILLEETTIKQEKILHDAQSEAKKILVETRKQRDIMMEEAEARTKQQVESMIKEAREQIAHETRETEKRLSSHVSQLAIQFLEKSLTSLFTQKEQQIIMEQAKKKIMERVN